MAFNSPEDKFENSVAAIKRLPDPFTSSLAFPCVKNNPDLFNHAAGVPRKIGPSHRVEQGGLGFSNLDPIGTEHVGNCVALIARDQTGKTALAHYDALSTSDSLQKVFDHLQGEKIDVYWSAQCTIRKP